MGLTSDSGLLWTGPVSEAARCGMALAVTPSGKD